MCSKNILIALLPNILSGNQNNTMDNIQYFREAQECQHWDLEDSSQPLYFKKPFIHQKTLKVTYKKKHEQ